MKKGLGLTLVMMLLAGSLYAASSTFNVQMMIRQPIAITQVSALNFGTIELPAVATNYTVVPGAGPHTAGTAATAAQFSVTGEPTALATASIPASVTAVNGATTLTFNLALSQTAITFGAGATTLYVGGNVNVPSTATLGTYATTALLTVLYN